MATAAAARTGRSGRRSRRPRRRAPIWGRRWSDTASRITTARRPSRSCGLSRCRTGPMCVGTVQDGQLMRADQARVARAAALAGRRAGMAEPRSAQDVRRRARRLPAHRLRPAGHRQDGSVRQAAMLGRPVRAAQGQGARDDRRQPAEAVRVARADGQDALQAVPRSAAGRPPQDLQLAPAPVADRARPLPLQRPGRAETDGERRDLALCACARR